MQHVIVVYGKVDAARRGRKLSDSDLLKEPTVCRDIKADGRTLPASAITSMDIPLPCALTPWSGSRNGCVYANTTAVFVAICWSIYTFIVELLEFQIVKNW